MRPEALQQRNLLERTTELWGIEQCRGLRQTQHREGGGGGGGVLADTADKGGGKLVRLCVCVCVRVCVCVCDLLTHVEHVTGTD